MESKHSKYLIRLLSSVDKYGYLKYRESAQIEFTANYNFGYVTQYSRTLAAFANNKGNI